MNPEQWAIIITMNLIAPALALGVWLSDRGIEPPRWLSWPTRMLAKFFDAILGWLLSRKDSKN